VELAKSLCPATGAVDQIRKLHNGRHEVETVWVITSSSSRAAPVLSRLKLTRQYWSIDNSAKDRLE
jgi:hypothetical protein